MALHRARTHIPPLVSRAINLSEGLGLPASPSMEAGRLLQILACQHPSGVILEIGTGCGIGSAWIASSLSPSTSFYTVEPDPALAAVARSLFDDLLNVRVVNSGWRDLLRYGRFSLLYVVSLDARQSEQEVLLRALREGGLLVLDGLIPQDQLPLEHRNRPDALRDFWLNDPRLVASEILVSPSEAVILATRVK